MKKKYAIAVSSGTAGLHLAVKALGWKKNHEVITTPFSYIASSNVLLYEGIKPIFVDIRRDLNLNPYEAEKKISKNTKGFLVVHIFGLPVDNYFREIADKYSLDILEDCCEAIGSPSNSFPITRMGKISVFGFHENKQITTAGEGGMIVTNDSRLAKVCYSLRDQGRVKGLHWWTNINLGFNYRMTEFQAAFGIAQFKKIDMILNNRDAAAVYYTQQLKELEHKIILPYVNGKKRSWFVYFITFKKSLYTNKVIIALAKQNIESKKYFKSLNVINLYNQLGYKKGDFPISETMANNTIALPFFTGIKISQINRVVNVIKKELM